MHDSNSAQAILLFDICDSTGKTQDSPSSREYYHNLKPHKDKFSTIVNFYKGYLENFSGDGGFACFSDVKMAMCAALAFRRATLNLEYKNRIALTWGQVTQINNETISHAINLSSKLEKACKTNQLVVSSEVLVQLKSLDIAFESLFTKDEESKQIHDKEEKYLEIPQENLTKNAIVNNKIYSFLNTLGLNLINLIEDDFCSDTTIIWPVVPRNELNLIHLGQISIMLFLNAHLGWDIKILIADLSDEKTNISEQYVKKIKQYFSRNGYACNDENFKYLSQLMKKDTASCCSITKDNFNEFFKKITFEKMEKYITKKNNPEKHKQQKVWKILRPFYTVAATTYLMNDLNKKCIIIAGNDECAMWNECSIDPEHKEKLGAILVPILSYNEDYQFSHDDENFYWQSTIIIKEEMDKSNIIDWVNNILIKPHDISFTKIIQNQDEELQKGALAEYIKNKLYEQR